MCLRFIPDVNDVLSAVAGLAERYIWVYVDVNNINNNNHNWDDGKINKISLKCENAEVSIIINLCV